MLRDPRPTCALYSIHLTIQPVRRLEPPSRLPEAKERTFQGTFVTPLGAIEAFNRRVNYSAWPRDGEPEVRDLIEGHVIYFRRHDGAWASPEPSSGE